MVVVGAIIKYLQLRGHYHLNPVELKGEEIDVFSSVPLGAVPNRVLPDAVFVEPCMGGEVPNPEVGRLGHSREGAPPTLPTGAPPPPVGLADENDCSSGESASGDAEPNNPEEAGPDCRLKRCC